jgi:hypothetical protein
VRDDVNGAGRVLEEPHFTFLILHLKVSLWEMVEIAGVS